MSGRDENSSAETHTPEPISEAERAANPIGAARRERDQQGRFATKADSEDESKPEDEQLAAVPDADNQAAGKSEGARKPGQVPQQALEAERRKRQERDGENEALKRQMADMSAKMDMLQRSAFQQPQAPQPQQPAQPPEFWQNPDAALDHRLRGALDPVMQQFETYKIGMSRNFAEQVHGKDAVREAIQGLTQLAQTNPAEFRRLEASASQSVDPVGDVVRWHKQQRALQTYGADPEAYIKAEVERRMSEMQGGQQQNDQRQQPAAQQPAQRLPNSFAGMPGGGVRGGAGYGGPRPLSEIMPRG